MLFRRAAQWGITLTALLSVGFGGGAGGDIVLKPEKMTFFDAEEYGGILDWAPLFEAGASAPAESAGMVHLVKKFTEYTDNKGKQRSKTELYIAATHNGKLSAPTKLDTAVEGTIRDAKVHFPPGKDYGFVFILHSRDGDKEGSTVQLTTVKITREGQVLKEEGGAVRYDVQGQAPGGGPYYTVQSAWLTVQPHQDGSATAWVKICNNFHEPDPNNRIVSEYNLSISQHIGADGSTTRAQSIVGRDIQQQLILNDIRNDYTMNDVMNPCKTELRGGLFSTNYSASRPLNTAVVTNIEMTSQSPGGSRPANWAGTKKSLKTYFMKGKKQKFLTIDESPGENRDIYQKADLLPFSKLGEKNYTLLFRKRVYPETADRLNPYDVETYRLDVKSNGKPKGKPELIDFPEWVHQINPTDILRENYLRRLSNLVEIDNGLCVALLLRSVNFHDSIAPTTRAVSPAVKSQNTAAEALVLLIDVFEGDARKIAELDLNVAEGDNFHDPIVMLEADTLYFYYDRVLSAPLRRETYVAAATLDELGL